MDSMENQSDKDLELGKHRNEHSRCESKAEHNSPSEEDFHLNAKDHVNSLTSDPRDIEPRAPDGGWGWVIVVATFVGHTIQALAAACFSILYIEWIQYFQCDSGVAGWIGSIHVCSGNVLCILFSKLTVVYGSRYITILAGLISSFGFMASFFAPNITTLYFTYGVLAGLGSGMFRLSSSIIVQRYFDKRRALASGIGLAGISLGGLISGPFSQFLISSLGWRGLMMVMSGVCLNIVVVGALYRPVELNLSKNKRQLLVDNTLDGQRTNRSDTLGLILDLLKTPVFLLCLFGNFFMQFGFMIYVFHSPYRTYFYGIDRQRVALLPTILGAFNIASRLVFGFVANLSCVNRMLQYGGGILAAGILMHFATLGTTYLTILISLMAVTFATASFRTVQVTVLVDLVGMQKFPMAMSMSLMVLGVSSLLATPIAGYLFDITGNYEVPFHFGGILQIIGGALIIAVPLVHRRQRKKEEQTTSQC